MGTFLMIFAVGPFVLIGAAFSAFLWFWIAALAFGFIRSVFK
jgi:hypothetical protein